MDICKERGAGRKATVSVVLVMCIVFFFFLFSKEKNQNILNPGEWSSDDFHRK